MNCRAASNSSSQGQTAKPFSSDDKGLPDSSACAVEIVPIPEPKRTTP
jgi:hypothetical protein